MKRLLTFSLLVALLTACKSVENKNGEGGNSGNTSTSTSEKTAPTAAKPPAVRDLVVARWSANSWYEGKVESLDSQRAKIAWSDNSTPSDVDLVDILGITQLS